MAKSVISTVIVIICIIIIGLYAAGEVNYFSQKTVSEKNITSPVVLIEKVGINEKINNVSLSQGVMLDEKSGIPTQGDVVLFGHRTLQGSPFLRLNEVNNGDTITLEWPGIGEVKYSVTNKKIVPATYKLETNQSGNHILLITCDPIGSTENRLIIELKAVNALHMAHEVQLVNYLTATGIDDGLLINFGSETLQFKRKFRIYRKRFE